LPKPNGNDVKTEKGKDAGRATEPEDGGNQRKMAKCVDPRRTEKPTKGSVKPREGEEMCGTLKLGPSEAKKGEMKNEANCRGRSGKRGRKVGKVVKLNSTRGDCQQAELRKNGTGTRMRSGFFCFSPKKNKLEEGNSLAETGSHARRKPNRGARKTLLFTWRGDRLWEKGREKLKRAARERMIFFSGRWRTTDKERETAVRTRPLVGSPIEERTEKKWPAG